MLQFRLEPPSQHQKENKLQRPCAQSISHPSRRSKMDTPALGQSAKKKIKRKPARFSFSFYNTQPFHFPIKPDPKNDQRNSRHKRRNRAYEVNRRAFHQIYPDAPQSDSQRKQR